MSVILCTAGYDHTIRFWEALSGICSRTIQHPESQVNRLCISPDKRWLAAAGNQNVKLYDIRSTNPNPLLTFEGHTGNVTGVAFHCEGRWMVTSSEDGTVKIWDTRSGTIQRNYIHNVPVNDVVIHPNQGEIISADRGGSVRIWDLGENKCTHELVPEPGCSVSSISVAGDGSLIAAANNNGNVYLWHLTATTTPPPSHSPQVNGSASSSTSPPTSSQGLYTTITPLTSFQAHNAYITRVLLSPDTHHLATCSADHNARIWTVDLHVKARVADPSNPRTPPLPHNPNLPLNPTTGKPVSVEEMARQQRTQPYLHRPHPIAPPNSTTTQIAAPSSGSSNPPLSASAAAQKDHPPPHHNNNNNNINTNNNPTTQPPTPLLLPPQTPNPSHPKLDTPFFLEATLDAHQRWVWDCAFSADSAYLVTSCSDHYARLWELGTRQVIRQYNGHHRGTVCVALNDFQEVRG